MANTYNSLSTVTVGSGGVANIQFTSIPQTYTDLCLIFSVRSNNSSAGSGLYESLVTRINNSATTSHYYSRSLRADGSNGLAIANYNGNVSWLAPGSYVNAANVTANTFSNFQLYIPNYSSSYPKSFVIDGSSPANIATQVGANFMAASLYNQTTAITSISLSPEYGSLWVENSTAHLYGIKKD